MKLRFLYWIPLWVAGVLLIIPLFVINLFIKTPYESETRRYREHKERRSEGWITYKKFFFGLSRNNNFIYDKSRKSSVIGKNIMIYEKEYICLGVDEDKVKGYCYSLATVKNDFWINIPCKLFKNKDFFTSKELLNSINLITTEQREGLYKIMNQNDKYSVNQNDDGLHFHEISTMVNRDVKWENNNGNECEKITTLCFKYLCKFVKRSALESNERKKEKFWKQKISLTMAYAERNNLKIRKVNGKTVIFFNDEMYYAHRLFHLLENKISKWAFKNYDSLIGEYENLELDIWFIKYYNENIIV